MVPWDPRRGPFLLRERPEFRFVFLRAKDLRYEPGSASSDRNGTDLRCIGLVLYSVCYPLKGFTLGKFLNRSSGNFHWLTKLSLSVLRTAQP